MIPPEALLGHLADYGLLIVAIVSVIEGPIVTVLSAFLAREGVFDLVPLALILIAGDLTGDLLHYAIGRRGINRVSDGWRRRLGLGPGRVDAIASHFDRRGGRTLVFAKLTHSIGAAVLVAAGIARMPVMPFLFWNAVATVPKTAGLMVLGWYAGETYRQVDLWLGRGVVTMLFVLLALGLAWFIWKRTCSPG